MDSMLFHPTSQVVWTPGTPTPNYGITAKGMDNPVILLAWSYKEWAKEIVRNGMG